MRACGASVSSRQRLRFRTLHTHRHNHLLRELREHPIQTMSLLRAAPLPTPLKIYGLSLFPAELIPLTSYAGIAITFNLLRAQHVQDVATEPGHPAARGLSPFGLALGTACRHGGPQALRAPKQSRVPLGPRSAALWPLRAAAKDTGAGATAVELLQPSGRGSPLARRWSLVWTLASSSASSLADAKNSSTAVTAGKISLLLVLLGLGTQLSRFAHAQLQAPALTRAPQIPVRYTLGACTPQLPPEHGACTPQVPPPYPGTSRGADARRAAVCRRPAASRVAGAPRCGRRGPQPHTQPEPHGERSAAPPPPVATPPRRAAAPPTHVTARGGLARCLAARPRAADARRCSHTLAAAPRRAPGSSPPGVTAYVADRGAEK